MQFCTCLSLNLSSGFCGKTKKEKRGQPEKIGLSGQILTGPRGGSNPRPKGLRDRNSPTCTLSQNGYGNPEISRRGSRKRTGPGCGRGGGRTQIPESSWDPLGRELKESSKQSKACQSNSKQLLFNTRPIMREGSYTRK